MRVGACPGSRPAGWLGWFAHPLGGGVCRGHTQYPAFLWALQKWQLNFLVSLYPLFRICPNCTYMKLLLVPYNFFVFCCLRRGVSRWKPSSTAAKVPCPRPVSVLVPLLKIRWPQLYGSICGLSILSHVSMFILLLLLDHLDYCAAAAKSRQSCPTLCDPIDSSPTGSSVPGILQARTLDWVAIPFSNAWKWKVKLKLFSCVRLLATPWIVAYQAPPSMGFSSSFVLNSEIGNCETTKLCSFSRLFWLIWILELPHGL